MTDNVTPLEALFERAEEYGKTSVDLLKLHAIDKSADVVSSLVSRLAVIIAVALFVLIISIGLALLAGELLGKSYYGFFLIGGLYAFIALLLYVFRHQLIKFPISNSIITQLRKIRIA